MWYYPLGFGKKLWTGGTVDRIGVEFEDVDVDTLHRRQFGMRASKLVYVPFG